MNPLEEYYGKFNEEKRFDSRHGQVEYRVTMKYIDECIGLLKADTRSDRALRIIDIGAGTGRYAVPLVHRGYEVCAVEPVNHNYKRMRLKSDRLVCKRLYAGNLKGIEDEYYDITLMLGPMYHLFTHEDKLAALSEAKRVTKKGGYILIGYCMNEYAFVTYAINEGNLSKCIKDGRLSGDFHCQSEPEDIYDYVRLEDIDRLRRESGLIRYKLISPDGPANYIRKALKELTDEEFEYFVAYVESIAERGELIGAAAHTVDILIRN